jgi:hypothetical protein
VFYKRCKELVREKGLEPSRLSAPEPKSGVYTNFTTPADDIKFILMSLSSITLSVATEPIQAEKLGEIPPDRT